MAADTPVLDVTEWLAPERTLLLDLLTQLSPADWELPTDCPAWNVKGVALHILGDDLSLLTRQRDASTDSLTLFAQRHPGSSFRERLDGFNEEWVTAAQFLSPSLVIEMLGLVGEWSRDFYCKVGLETVSREPVMFFAADGPSPYWQVIGREYVERFVHQSQIRRAVGAGELEGQVVRSAAEVVVYALAQWLRNYAPTPGATIAMEFGAAGSWTWRREANHWAVLEGETGAADARVTIAPDRVVAMLSRGISVDEAGSLITVTGDTAVAGPALEVMRPMLGTPEA